MEWIVYYANLLVSLAVPGGQRRSGDTPGEICVVDLPFHPASYKTSIQAKSDRYLGLLQLSINPGNIVNNSCP